MLEEARGAQGDLEEAHPRCPGARGAEHVRRGEDEVHRDCRGGPVEQEAEEDEGMQEFVLFLLPSFSSRYPPVNLTGTVLTIELLRPAFAAPNMKFVVKPESKDNLASIYSYGKINLLIFFVYTWGKGLQRMRWQANTVLALMNSGIYLLRTYLHPYLHHGQQIYLLEVGPKLTAPRTNLVQMTHFFLPSLLASLHWQADAAYVVCPLQMSAA